MAVAVRPITELTRTSRCHLGGQEKGKIPKSSSDLLTQLVIDSERLFGLHTAKVRTVTCFNIVPTRSWIVTYTHTFP